MKMWAVIGWIGLWGAAGSVAAQQLKVIDRCYLVAIDEVRLPATDAGMLTNIAVDEGDLVEVDQLLAQIDDREAVMAKQVAQHQYQAAKKQAENEISVSAAVKQYEVSRAELDTATEANRRVEGSYSPTEVRRLNLAWERAGLQIDLARFENLVAALDARAKYAQYEQASAMIERRKLIAPHSGVVNQIFRNEGDWVTPGDPVMHLVRLDQLRVHGRVNADDWGWRDLKGRPIDVVVTLPGGLKQTVSSQIGFASQVIEDDGSFRIWADIDNVREGSGWIMGPGLKAEIQLK